MKYMGDSKFWDGKFRSRSDTPLKPEKSIVEHLSILQGETLLDIACGDGRNSLFLLENGFKVTGIDFSKDGLKRLKRFAGVFGDRLETKCIDLTKEDCFKDIGRFDNIVVCHYRLQEYQLKSLSNIVSKNGVVIITGFSENHTCDQRIGESELIYKKDIESLLPDFDLIEEKEEIDHRGAFITYVLRRK